MRKVGDVMGELGGALGEPGTGKRVKAKARGNGKHRGNGAQKPARKSATGRIDAAGQEKVIDKQALSKNMSDLLGLLGKSQQAAVAFREKVKGVAERAGLLASTVRAVVVAHSKGDEVVAEKKRDAEQLVLALDLVGE